MGGILESGNTVMPVSDICYSLGFENPTHFPVFLRTVSVNRPRIIANEQGVSLESIRSIKSIKSIRSIAPTGAL